MKYIINASTDPYYNQAFEQSVFDKCESDSILLVWRNSPTVVCGRNQNIFAEVDLLKARKNGVALVRRDTGGGTVYHDLGNVNYTLICDTNSIAVNYEPFIQKVVSALQSIGITAHANKTCDIAINGMKISGSAQRQTKTRVLHHGTLLFDTCLDTLNDFSLDRSSCFESKAIASNRCTVTNIKEHTNSFRDVESFMQAFIEAMGCSEHTLPDNDLLQTAQELCESKYKSWDWTYGKNPKFTKQKNKGDLSLQFGAKRGIITEFSCNALTFEQSRNFVGMPLNPDMVYKACNQLKNKKIADTLYELIFG